MKLYKALLSADLTLHAHDVVERVGYGSADMDILKELGFGESEGFLLLMEGSEILKKTQNLFAKYSGIGKVTDVTDNYVILETTAPKAYDGFSTTQLFAGEKPSSDPLIDKPVRIVAMEHRDFEWQTMRYSSGMHYWAIIQGGEKP